MKTLLKVTCIFHTLFLSRQVIIWLFFSVLISNGTTLTGQNDQHVFAFVQNIRGKSALQESKNYKYETARAVFDNLLRSRADFRQQAPALVMNDGEQYVAWMDPDKIQIGLEEKAYDICISFGADSLNALAALLGHELVHYFEKHDWSRHFAAHNQDMESAKRIGNMKEGLKQEAQADYLGGFLATTAGYSVYNLMPQLLKKIYTHYGLPEQIDGYPGLGERVSMSDNAMQELKVLQTVFATAGHLTLLKQYEDAAAYYRYILNTFPSREIYNNAGANLLLAATLLYAPTEMPYALPVELDPTSRLFGLKAVTPNRNEQRKLLLEEAFQHIDRAILLDPKYSPAYLNKASVFVLLGQWDDAAYWILKGRKAPTQYREADYLILEGIAAALQNDKTSARQKFEKAQEGGYLLAEINLRALDQLQQDRSRATPAIGLETMEKINLDDFLLNPSVDSEIEVGPRLLAGAKQLKGSRILVHYADNGRRYAVFHLCESGCIEMTKSLIGVGSDKAAIFEAYGAPAEVVSQPDGLYLIYPLQRVFFKLNKTNSVVSWGIYRLSNEI